MHTGMDSLDWMQTIFPAAAFFFFFFFHKEGNYESERLYSASIPFVA